jgi:hypothetical protein
MHYPDLSPYSYGRTDPAPNILNVGWLSREHEYVQGLAPAGLLPVLKRLIKTPVNLYRGYHYCEFCPEPRIALSPTGLRIFDGAPESLGNGEIRVVAGDGTVLVAPVLIAHYIEAHGYLPPPQFTTACLDHTGVQHALERARRE